MSEHGLLVIGGGPAGLGAATAYREHRPDDTVRILTSEQHPPYRRPPLSKDYLRGDDMDLALQDPDFYTEQRIEVATGETVTAIDTAAKTVTTDAGTTYPWSSLVLATGASPSGLPVPGGDTAHVLRSIVDADRLRDAAAGASKAVVVGAGFIGCEAAASLAMRGVEVTVVAPDEAPQIARLGEGVGKRIVEVLAQRGVQYRGGVKVEEVTDAGVRLDDGTEIAGDLVVAATGVTPSIDLAEAAGIVTAQGRIAVDDAMRSSAADVYAVGDVAFAQNPTAGRRLAVEHWSDADKQGAVAGTVAAGGDASWGDVPGFNSVIGDTALRYHAWGDGYDDVALVEHPDGGLTAWYTRDGACVGVLTIDADDDYELGERLIAERRPAPTA